jgi:8-oxo-dGTP pyrophosphatase MutT (NUDIX family)
MQVNTRGQAFDQRRSVVNNQQNNRQNTEQDNTQTNQQPDTITSNKPIRPRQDFIRERRSIGIACCRIQDTKPQILLVRKRYTYAYNIFVNGKYKSNDNHGLIELFSGMTIDEKLDILSLNFIQIWYRMWLNSAQRTEHYFIAKNKFESTFAGGERLRRLIAKSTHASRVWEIPKGRKSDKLEPDIHCAIREFQEETGISKANYKIVSDVAKSYSYIDCDVRYVNVYYLALASVNAVPHIDFNANDQVGEVSDIRWMDIEDIRRIDPRLAKFVRPIFNYMRKYK